MADQLKKKLYNYCVQYAQSRISNAQKAMEAAQNSANSETKSTAGDKHDTARAMMQLEVEQQAKQLSEANKIKQALFQFNSDSGKNSISLGSLVQTNSATYYISISIGKIDLDGGIYFAISPVSPVGKALFGKHEGENFDFNGKRFSIVKVD